MHAGMHGMYVNFLDSFQKKIFKKLNYSLWYRLLNFDFKRNLQLFFPYKEAFAKKIKILRRPFFFQMKKLDATSRDFRKKWTPHHVTSGLVSQRLKICVGSIARGNRGPLNF